MSFKTEEQIEKELRRAHAEEEWRKAHAHFRELDSIYGEYRYGPGIVEYRLKALNSAQMSTRDAIIKNLRQKANEFMQLRDS